MASTYATTSAISDMWDDSGTAATISNHFNTFVSNTLTSNKSTVAWTSSSSQGTTYKKFAQNGQTIVISSSNDLNFAVVPSKSVAASHELDDKGRIVVRAGDVLILPDGTEIVVDQSGNYVINDQDAKVVYKANRNLEFNRYINASDLLEEFLRYLKSMGVSRKDVMKIDLGIFITWLIVAAAEADGMEKPQEETLMLEHQVKPISQQPKCMCCKRFIKRKTAEAGILFCSGVHMDRYRERVAA